MRLLKLSDYAQKLIESGDISAGHGRALLSVPDADKTIRDILNSGLSVRDVEALAKQQSNDDSSQKRTRKKEEKDADTRALEQRITQDLGLVVSIKNKGEKGEISIKYTSLEQLDLISQRLSNP